MADANAHELLRRRCDVCGFAGQRCPPPCRLIKTPLDVLESTADVAADQMAILFRPLLPIGAGITLEDIIGTSTSDTEAAAMKVR